MTIVREVLAYCKAASETVVVSLGIFLLSSEHLEQCLGNWYYIGVAIAHTLLRPKVQR